MHQYLKPNTEEVASKVVDGEAILINLSNGMYYSMDTVGGYIWSLVTHGHDLEAISSAVAQHYGIDEETAKQDVNALAAQLIEERIAIPADAGTQATPPEMDKSPAEDAYATPQLSKFDDMVDLFAIDPPLPELSKLNNRGGGGS